MTRTRPQVRRAWGIVHVRRSEFAPALEHLYASAAEAREQGALVQLARTLHTLAEVAAAEAERERRAIVAHIGPLTVGLTWAR